MLEFILLGTGSSGGVPRITGDWGFCDPKNPKNRRTRCSLLVRRGEGSKKTEILIDSSPDMRAQLIAAGTTALDAVLYSHDHADQSHGIDDLRAMVYARRQRMDVWMDDNTAKTLMHRFSYCFEQLKNSEYPSILKRHTIARPYRPIDIDGAGGVIRAVPFRQIHGRIDSIGFRIGGLAYSSDVSEIPDESADALRGLDVWIVDALRRDPHPTHFHLARTLQEIERFQPKRAILTNLHIDMDYETLKRELPQGVEPAFDGLRITL